MQGLALKVQMVKKNMNTNEELFITYFKENPYNSYQQFREKYIHISLKEIDTIRKRLQRKNVLTCIKSNSIDGTFVSKKIINLIYALD